MRYIILAILIIFSTNIGAYDYDGSNSDDAETYISSMQKMSEFLFSNSNEDPAEPQVIHVGEPLDQGTEVVICDYFREEYVCFTLNRR